jgi:probable F420-dependent oxidoreductase
MDYQNQKTSKERQVKIGIQTMFDGRQTGPLTAFIMDFGRHAEASGFASIWMSEHVVTFEAYDPAYRYPYADDGIAPGFLADAGMLDPLSALMVLATCTSQIMLGTGIAILPQRNPVYFAKQGTDVDLLSNGRFLAGLGLGWSGQEYEALGVPFAHRGSRLNEYVEVVRSLWQDDVSSFTGAFYALPRCVQKPKPARRPHPPFYFGGESEPALRRTAKQGDGWLAFRLTPAMLAPRIARLRELLAEAGRPEDAVDIIVSPADYACDADTLAGYATLGVSQVTFPVVAGNIDDARWQLDQLAATMLAPAAGM